MRNKTWSVLFSCIILFFVSHLVFGQNQQNARALYDKGFALQKRENYYKAIEQYKMALQHNPHYLDPMVGLAESYFRLDEYKEALDYITDARKYAKERVHLMNLEGRIRITLGNLERARKLFNNVLEREPNNVEARFGLGELDVAEGKLEEASNKFENTLQISPENRKALLSLALIYETKGELEIAEKYINIALEEYPQEPKVYYHAAYYNYIKNNLRKAKEYAQTAISLEKSYIAAKLLLADLLIEERRFDNAVPYLEEILNETPDNIRAWYTLGIVRSKMNDTQKAIEHFQRALTEDPSAELIRIALENVIIKNMELENNLRSIYGQYHFEQGEEYQEKNLYQKALEEYRRGLRVDPYSKKGRILFAEIYNKLGYEDKYLNELKFLKSIGKNDTDIEEAIEIQQSLMYDTVSGRWGIDQYSIEHHSYDIDIFYTKDIPVVKYPLMAENISYYIRDILLSVGSVSIPESPAYINSFAEGFEKSRKRESNYFLILKFDQNERSFSLQAKMYLSRTGSLIKEFTLFRTGNNRIRDASIHFKERLSNILPLQAILLRRKFDEGLINRGHMSGVKKDTKYSILRKGALELSSNNVELIYDKEDILGTFTVTNVDERVAEGTIEKRGFYDLINIKDRLVNQKTENVNIEKENNTYLYPSLYSHIRELE